MAKDWHELTKVTKDLPIIVERVRLASNDIAIEGSFELPPLARLPSEDQIFIAAFVRCHGSIKEMERTFGISYPTVKNRLDRIARQLEFAEVLPLQTTEETTGEATVEMLDKLEKGEITGAEAIERLSK